MDVECLLFMPCVVDELVGLLYHQHPLQPPESLLELPEVIDEVLSDGQWKFQPTKMVFSNGSYCYTTWLPYMILNFLILVESLRKLKHVGFVASTFKVLQVGFVKEIVIPSTAALFFLLFPRVHNTR